MLLATGTLDPYVIEEEIDRLAELLREGGAEVTHLKAERGHELGPDDLAAVGDWLEPGQARA